LSPELQSLIRLQDIDVRSFELKDRLAAIPKEREQLEEEFRRQAADYLALETNIASARASRKQLEADLAEIEHTHEKFKADLMKVRNQKEYTTVLREIDASRKTIGALETEALQAMERIEALEQQLAEREPEFTRRRAEVDRLLEDYDREVNSLQAELDELLAARAEIAKDVSAQMMRVYERVAQTRQGRAMSEVRGGKCTMCNLSLRPQVYADVRQGDALVVCDNCSRILFYRPEVEAPVEANAN
jgi:hypothetical protein